MFTRRRITRAALSAAVACLVLIAGACSSSSDGGDAAPAASSDVSKVEAATAASSPTRKAELSDEPSTIEIAAAESASTEALDSAAPVERTDTGTEGAGTGTDSGSVAGETEAPAATDATTSAEASNETTAAGSTVGDRPGSAATALPDGWVLHQIGRAGVAAPADWQIADRPGQLEDIESTMTALAETVVRSRLAAGDAIAAIDASGSNVVTFRTSGRTTDLVDFEELAVDLETRFESASDVEFVSEPRMIGEIPGVLVRGSYTSEGRTSYVYRFVTHQGVFLYYFTVTIVDEDDPALATTILRSVATA